MGCTDSDQCFTATPVSLSPIDHRLKYGSLAASGTAGGRCSESCAIMGAAIQTDRTTYATFNLTGTLPFRTATGRAIAFEEHCLTDGLQRTIRARCVARKAFRRLSSHTKFLSGDYLTPLYEMLYIFVSCL